MKEKMVKSKKGSIWKEQKKIKYTVKDTVFTLLFKDLENAKKLYANLHNDADRFSD